MDETHPATARQVTDPAAAPRFGRARDHVPWAAGAAVLAVGLIGPALATNRSGFEDTWQDWLGIAALVLLVASLTFALRKRLYGSRLGPLRPWYLAHVWAAVLWGPVAWVHADGHARGLLYATLAAACWLAWLSGLAGIVLQQALARLRQQGRLEAALLEDLELERERLREEITDLAAGREEWDRYRQELGMPELGRDSVSTLVWLRRAVEPGRARDRLRGRARELGRTLDHEQAGTLERLVEDGLELSRVEARISLSHLRESWLTAHIVSSLPAVVLVAVHVFAILWY